MSERGVAADSCVMCGVAHGTVDEALATAWDLGWLASKRHERGEGQPRMTYWPNPYRHGNPAPVVARPAPQTEGERDHETD